MNLTDLVLEFKSSFNDPSHNDYQSNKGDNYQ